MDLASFAAVIATVLATVALVPQTARLARTGSSEGVSPTWAAYGVVTNGMWVAYLASQRLWIGVVATVIVVAFFTAVLVLVRRIDGGARAAIRAGAAWGVILAGSALVAGWRGLGLVLGISYGVEVAPAIWAIYRTRTPRGVSPGTWWLAGVEAVLWGWYGAAKGDLPLVLFGIVALTASALVLGRYAATRRRWEPIPEPAISR